MRSSSQVHKSIGAAALALGLTVSASAMATHQSRAVGDFNAKDSRAIEEMVRDYILNHPEVIIEAAEISRWAMIVSPLKRLVNQWRRKIRSSAAISRQYNVHILGSWV